jgi:peptidoglycan/LPS O-acetylase OafA/YrhL
LLGTPLQPAHVLVNLTMLQEGIHVLHVDPVYWTLWVELRFYLLFALVIHWGVTYRRTVTFCALWTVVSLLAASTDDAILKTIAMPEYSPYFIAGVAMYLMHRFQPTALLWGIVGRDLPGLPAVLLVAGFFAVMLGLSLGCLTGVRWPWLSTLGAMSYPLYLLHLTIGWTVFRLLHDKVPTRLLLIGVIAAMLLASWLVHRIVERPLAARLRPVLLRGLQDIRLDEANIPADLGARAGSGSDAATGVETRSARSGRELPIIPQPPRALPAKHGTPGTRG